MPILQSIQTPDFATAPLAVTWHNKMAESLLNEAVMPLSCVAEETINQLSDNHFVCQSRLRYRLANRLDQLVSLYRR
jgi:hypothetical protein